MTPQQLQKAIATLFKRHGVELLEHDDWLLQGGTFPAIRANWTERPEGRSGRLDIEIVAGPGRYILESFAGVGGGEVGCKDAFQQFVINDFHVLLAAFWGIQRPEEVTVEHWEIGGQLFTAFIGGFGTRASVEGPVVIPPQAFITVEAALKKTDLPQSLHWARIFHCNINGQDRLSEALLDNEPWPEGEAALKSIDWPVAEHYYSVRNFMILKGPEVVADEDDMDSDGMLEH